MIREYSDDTLIFEVTKSLRSEGAERDDRILGFTSNGNWELLSSKCPRWFVEARGNVGVDFEAAAGEAEL